MPSYLDLTVTNHIARLTFNRPKANSYDLDFMQQFNNALDQAQGHADVRVVVIQSALQKFFCAGADIFAFQKNSTETNRKLVDLARRATAAIESSDKVFIASINGHTLGGGLEIAMACDLRIGGDGAYLLGLPEVKLGLMPGNGGSQRLARIVGFSKALELTVTGDSISPQEAHRIGLLHRLVPVDQVHEQTDALAGQLAQGPPMAMSAIKQAVRVGAEMPLKDGLALEAKLVDGLYDTQDAHEGFTAYLEKRSPVYRGN